MSTVLNSERLCDWGSGIGKDISSGHMETRQEAVSGTRLTWTTKQLTEALLISHDFKEFSHCMHPQSMALQEILSNRLSKLLFATFKQRHHSQGTWGSIICLKAIHFHA